MMTDSTQKSSGAPKRDVFGASSKSQTWMPVIGCAILLAFVAIHFYQRDREKKSEEAQRLVKMALREAAASIKSTEEAQKAIETASREGVPQGPTSFTIPPSPDSPAKTNAP
jgi:hypothetical protein